MINIMKTNISMGIIIEKAERLGEALLVWPLLSLVENM
jgi:hypothetical protein